MAVWLLALAWQAARPGQPKSGVPRRLVWVVNRRVVVDQATEEAEDIREHLADRRIEQLRPVRDVLATLSPGQENREIIAISTLRGEREDNREWSKDPSRPAVIVGTVDMIGSRLLFSGYGNGPYWRPQDAGLLGHDVLLINDEAHLTPAFASLLASLERNQRDTANGTKPFWIMRLSATHVNPQGCWPHSLQEDLKYKRFRKIFEAKKILNIHAVNKQDSKLIELAMESTPVPLRTLIFLREPAKVQDIAARLSDKVGADAAKRILTLTGTMRGFERDQLVLHPVFQSFTKAERPKEPAWIIATSAGEVGVNITADRLISDMDTAEHLLQRFGRLNRFGETEGIANLLISPLDEKDLGKSDQKAARRRATLAYLRKLPKLDGERYDISPAALFHTPPPSEACEEIPLQAVLHDWLIDIWSQTSLRGYTAGPPVEPWLHGKGEEDYPETYLAWREDVRDLVKGSIDDEDREAVLDKYRILAHERLREPTGRLQEKFRILLEKEPTLREERVLCLRQDGSVSVMGISDIADQKRRNEIVYSQLIVPPGCGALKNGMFSPEVISADNTAYDVAGCKNGDAPDQVVYDEQRACYRAVPAVEGGWSLERLGSVAEEQRQRERIFRKNLEPKTLRDFAKDRDWRLLLAVEPEAEEDDESRVPFVLLYFRHAGAAKSAASTVYLKDHLAAVAEQAYNLGTRLGFGKEVVQALKLAGELHDSGKGRGIWQNAVGNSDLSNPMAKSIGRMRPRDLNGFRHELASLCDAESTLKSSDISDEARDLALHLIAAHHGRARPCFETKAYDRDNHRESERLALEAAQRFGRLQDRYGAWGLAYLEAVFKAADQLASDEEQPPYA